MSRIKFCGLSRLEDIEAANRLRPDYIGFILAHKGHRQISEKRAATLKAALHPSIKAFGVFINENPEVIERMAKSRIIDGIQLHGSEDEAYIKELKKRIPEVPIVQAFAIENKEDVRRAAASSADLVLLDYKDSGSGKSFDWNLLEEIGRDYLLAGGINESNLEQALELKPFGLDISSGIESDKKKDPEKMERILRRIRGTVNE